MNTSWWFANPKEYTVYGSSRLGVAMTYINPVEPATIFTRMRKNKYYELSNHLGNVLATIQDRKVSVDVGSNGTIDYYTAYVTSTSDYYAFGASMPGRGYVSANTYRYGFNGKEKDDEVVGNGNRYDFGDRIYDPRIGRWLSLDPNQINYPANSPYNFSLNSPLMFNDPDGRDAVVTVQKNKDGGGTITISSIVYITGKNATPEKAEYLTCRASEVYKDGNFTNKQGKDFKIKFDVKYVYAEDKSAIKLKKGENILEFVDEKVTSNVSRVTTTKKDEKGNTVVSTSAGTKGIVGRKDTGKAEEYSTLHETLHLLGLGDRYKEGKDETGARQTTPNEGFENDIMGKYYQEGISQVHYDNWGQKYSGKAAGEYILNKAVDLNSKGELKGTPPAKKEEAK